VDFARGYPSYHPRAGAAVLLGAGDVDAALVIGTPASLPATVATGLARVRGVVIGPRASAATFQPAVAVDTGLAGIHEAARRSAWTTSRCRCGRRSRHHMQRWPPCARCANDSAHEQFRGAPDHGRHRARPRERVDGVVRDVCIEGDRIVGDLPSSAPRLDARGMVVMPGGVDIHAHIAGSSVNHARRLLPEEHAADPVTAPRLEDGAVARSGTGGTLPSTFATGYRYAGSATQRSWKRRWRPSLRGTRTRSSTTLPSSMPASSSSWATTTTCSASSPR